MRSEKLFCEYLKKAIKRVNKPSKYFEKVKNYINLSGCVRATALSVAACAVLMCLCGTAKAVTENVSIKQTNSVVSGGNFVKKTEFAPLPLSCFPSAFNSPTSSERAKTVDKYGVINPTKCDFNGDPFDSPQCTWYAWARVKAISGISLKFHDQFGRHARYWLNEIVETDNVKVVRKKAAVRENSVAVFKRGGKGKGHVVVVEKVIRGADGTPKNVIISESNWGKQKKPVEKKLSWDTFLERSDGSLLGYIYF
jgi:surface antigen